MHIDTQRSLPFFGSEVIADETMTPEGLTHVRNFLTVERQAQLLAEIDDRPWRTDLKRRVQHYGWSYDYRATRVASSDRLGPLPEWMAPEANQLAYGHGFSARPNQAIVNEYEPGQGIAAHVDCAPCFGDVVASVSLASACNIDFRERGSDRRFSLVLEPGSLLVMAGPSRFEWTHAIPPRKSDVIEGVRQARKRRVSVTFRTVNP